MSTEFARFIESLRSPTSHVALSPERLAAALDLPIQKLAALAGVHRNTVTLAPSSPKLQAAMTDILRVLSASHALTRNIDSTLFWFRNQPITALRHCTPMQLVEQRKVRALIDHIADRARQEKGEHSA
jgi:hypothetical protein